MVQCAQPICTYSAQLPLSPAQQVIHLLRKYARLYGQNTPPISRKKKKKNVRRLWRRLRRWRRPTSQWGICHVPFGLHSPFSISRIAPPPFYARSLSCHTAKYTLVCQNLAWLARAPASPPARHLPGAPWPLLLEMYSISAFNVKMQ